MNIKKLMKNWKVIILVLFVIFAIITINPQVSSEGVVIKHVEQNSTASRAGIENPGDVPETKLEKITSVNGNKVSELEEYINIINNLQEEEVLRITTNKGSYSLLNKGDLGLTVKEAPSSNIKKGLELAGGTRVVLEPEEDITDEKRNELIASMENRLNVYGLSDVKIRPADDLLGNKYIVVEVAGTTQEEVRNLIEKQGKFEAKIGNETVFRGGKEDITFVCRNDGTCAGVKECNEANEGYACNFEFAIRLSEQAAEKHAKVTKDIPLTMENGKEYLTEKLDLYLDDKLVDSLRISSGLKGKPVRDIAISGGGFGTTKAEALNDALDSMNHLQTILITGSLDVKLDITKFDSVSPILGEEFVKNAFLIGILAILAVAAVVFIRYRNFKITLPLIFTSISEILILLGVAAFVKWNLDLPAIAGIIAAVGTGVDDLIVIVDEVSRKESYFNWKDRIKRAFFIIFVAYATTVVAMIPLLKAGAGLLTGFALMTIAGVSIGVLITRPAFAAIIENIMEE